VPAIEVLVAVFAGALSAAGPCNGSQQIAKHATMKGNELPTSVTAGCDKDWSAAIRLQSPQCWGSGGRRFESGHPDQFFSSTYGHLKRWPFLFASDPCLFDGEFHRRRLMLHLSNYDHRRVGRDSRSCGCRNGR
jgi:hypothetical protein